MPGSQFSNRLLEINSKGRKGAYPPRAKPTPVPPPTPDLRVFNWITICCYNDDVGPEELVLPLEMIARGPSQASYKHKVDSRTAPTTLHYKPVQAGRHFITLREVAHRSEGVKRLLDPKSEKTEVEQIVRDLRGLDDLINNLLP